MDPNATLFPDFARFVTNVTEEGLGMGHPLGIALNLHTNEGIDACQLRYSQFCDAVGWPFAALGVPVLDAAGNSTFANALFEVYLDAPPLDRVDTWWCDYGDGGSTHPQLYLNRVFYDHSVVKAGGKRGLAFSRYGNERSLLLGAQRYPMGFTGDSFEHEATLSWQVEATPMSANVLYGW